MTPTPKDETADVLRVAQARIIDPSAFEVGDPDDQYCHPYGVGAFHHERRERQKRALAKVDALAALSDRAAERPEPKLFIRSREWWLSRIDAEPDVVIGAGTLARAYEVVRHASNCPAIGGAGDKDCRCDAVPFLNDLAVVLTGPKPSDRAAEREGEEDELTRLRVLAGKVDAIRNSIIGAQAFNWSEHAYTLVAALGEAGYPGQEYETARANVGTLIEQTKAAEAERDALSRRLEAVEGALRASLAKRSVATIDPPYTAAFNAALDMVARDIALATTGGAK